MSIQHNDITFTVDNKPFELSHIEQYEKGDYCGYISAMLLDVENDTDYEVLYRITDKMNANNDNKIQSIDYGYSMKNAEVVFNETEKQLQNLVNTLRIDYQEIEEYQKTYA